MSQVKYSVMVFLILALVAGCSKVPVPGHKGEDDLKASKDVHPAKRVKKLLEKPPAPVEDAGTQGTDTAYAVVKVFYGTDRKLTDSSATAEKYAGDRGEFTYGICEVSIPWDHQVGELEKPSVLKFEFREDPEKHIVLLNIKVQSEKEFFGDLALRVGQSPGKKAFVFVHGYSVTFEDAARRTAQMAFDLNFDGAPMFYSWPSKGTFEAYPVDETNIEWTQAHLKKFLEDVATRSEAETIYLIAHSMGNRALSKAFITLLDELPKEKISVFREIILTAPDIDADVFKQDIAPRLISSPSRVTLYVSSTDKALLASKTFHGYPRTGDLTDGQVIVDGIETIDATKVDTSFLGHSYFKSVISDLHSLIRDGNGAAERPGLSPVVSPVGKYWEFRKQN